MQVLEHDTLFERNQIVSVTMKIIDRALGGTQVLICGQLVIKMGRENFRSEEK
jgi:hypothetical protein